MYALYMLLIHKIILIIVVLKNSYLSRKEFFLMYRLRHKGLFKCIHNHNNWYIITHFTLIIRKLVRMIFQLHSACGLSHDTTHLYAEIPQKYNYIVYFNTQPTFWKLTKLVVKATFILFQTCLKIEFCWYNDKRNINLIRMKQCHR